MTIKKVSATYVISNEMLYFELSLSDARFSRLVERVETFYPTPEDWAEYRKAKRLLKKLRKNRYYYEMGGDEYTGVTKPEPVKHYTYAETHEEHMARCALLLKEEQ